MADRQAEIIPFNRDAPAPDAPRPAAQIVPIPSMSYRLLGKNLDAEAMAARLAACLRAGDPAGAAEHWRAHIASVEAGAAALKPAEVARMLDAYRAAVRAEIGKLKGK